MATESSKTRGTSGNVCFGPVDHWLLMGGGGVLLETSRRIRDRGRRVTVFSAERHQSEAVGSDGTTLAAALNAINIPIRAPEDINTDPVFLEAGRDGGLAIGFGETWTFTSATVAMYNSRLLDLMGIPLPQYRGGAHYTWMILRRDRRMAVHLQLINEDMVQGEFDSGALVKSREYEIPLEARIPADYFHAAHAQEIVFLEEFVDQVEANAVFDLSPVPESQSMLFPRLHTLSHGWIDWSWRAEEIEAFICAFDKPYPGASTFINGRRVYLRDAHARSDDGTFHPFQRGLIYRTGDAVIHVAATDGTIEIGEVRGEDGEDLLALQKPGDRFHTPSEQLDQALSFKAMYGAAGLEH